VTEKQLTALGGLTVLLGIGLLILFNLGVWPWVLAVLALAGVPTAAAADRLAAGVQSAVWLASFAALIYWDAWWPWVLVPIVLTAVAGIVLSRHA
jgi:hypothetical protein